MRLKTRTIRPIARLSVAVAGLAGVAGPGHAQAPATKTRWMVAIGEEAESLDPRTRPPFDITGSATIVHDVQVPGAR